LLRVSSTFLPDSDGGTFQSFVHDIGHEQQALERITRLQNFYAFLSKVNAAIFNLKDRDAILNTVCESALWHGDFVLAWAGVPEDHIGMVVPVAICGEASDYVKSLRITTDPALPTSQGPTRQCMVDGKIHYTDDFQSDARTLPWHEFGHKYGLNSSAAIPVLAAGKAVAVLTFYSAIKGFFDLEMRALLEETARNVSQALQLAEAEWARSSSMLAHHVSEERFARVFSASPVPMQISSVSSRRIRSINKAHERTFGFSMEEISSESNWFEAVYPDPVFRAQMQEIWYQHALPEAMQGGPERVVTSPEIRLRCKSGAERIMRGFMSVVGDDAVTQWEDLTELKDAETRLAQDEARFRSLIEQTLTGIYVTQDSKIVYANPRFCEILGQHTEDLIGRDPQELIAQTPQARHMLKNESERIQSGELGQLMALPFTTRDGKHIDLGMQANIGLWNGRPAVIVISQDITERRRAEEKIATYVKQLEGTMRGTLQAVANMVDLRDPYTSGHERRVGVIAADIAREMGWSEDRCQSLQLIGLVHDIGKIAIPAEILSKPTRLTALEYEMVKTHAERGFEILKDVEFPMPIAEIIREHHERMDGSGYPHGLLGNAIMPEARVLAVADVLESMASHRPYRPALGLAAAMDEIESHRATWFDPQVVDATLRLLRDKAYELPK
jgi:PAS domain S-box-containing protein/putative nucleotidyltransferase with HDIG domain